MTTVTVDSQAGQGKGLDLFLGPGSEPSGWQNLSFSDASWSAMVQSNATGSGYAPDGAGSTWGTKIAGTFWIVPTTLQGNSANADTWLHRVTFSLPAGTVASATIQAWCDNQIDDIWVNGTALSYFLFLGNQLTTRPGPTAVTTSLFIPGATNILAVKCENLSGPTSLDYELVVTQGAGRTPRQQAYVVL